jgi:hypothetical protein
MRFDGGGNMRDAFDSEQPGRFALFALPQRAQLFDCLVGAAGDHLFHSSTSVLIAGPQGRGVFRSQTQNSQIENHNP